MRGQKKKITKPRPLEQMNSRGKTRGSYAGISKAETKFDHSIYIGGDYYESSAQIHLFPDEAERLGKWLLKAAKYFEQRERK
jgi:hypothetical protein